MLETLSPGERIAFVLHDTFGIPFDEIARIIGCTELAGRQLASRARRRVEGADRDMRAARDRQRELVEAFFTASRAGNLEALLAVLDPQVVLRADSAAVQLGASSEVRGAATVAGWFSRRSQGAQLALVDGVAGAVWAPGGKLRVAMDFTSAHGRIVAIRLLAEREVLDQIDVEIL